MKDLWVMAKNAEISSSRKAPLFLGWRTTGGALWLGPRSMVIQKTLVPVDLAMELESRRREAVVGDSVPSWEAGEIPRDTLLPLPHLIISYECFWHGSLEIQRSASPPHPKRGEKNGLEGRWDQERTRFFCSLLKKCRRPCYYICRFWSWHLDLVYQRRPGKCGEFQVSDRTCPT